jgi:hypothetical protein
VKTQVIKAKSNHQMTRESNNDLIKSRKKVFLLVLLKPNFSSITNVE